MPAPLLQMLFVTVLILSVQMCGCFSLGSVYAAELLPATSTLAPNVPKGRGENCVADTDIMRRDHMSMLNHQRDDTVHDGIRTKRFSLKECIDCHAVNGPDARPVTAESPKHFCRTCHDYAAVKIDCFECHASRPEIGKAARYSVPDEHRKALASYLTEARP